MPDTVQFRNGNEIINRYAADGRKMGTRYFTLTNPVVVPMGETRQWQAPVEGKDKTTAASTIQRTQYYPSGLPFASLTNDNPEIQPYKFNGKEFVTMHGYDMYDYGMRAYYAAIMRFTTPDPLAEKYYSVSPYAYCGNNPVNRIDPDGRNPVVIAAGGVAAVEALLLTTGVIATGILLYKAQNGTIGLKPGLFGGSKTKETKKHSPEYDHQRKREREERDKQNEREVNVAKNIEDNVTGTMPNGDPAPKRDPNDGGKKTKVATVVSAIGAAAAGVSSIIEGTEPQNEIKAPENPKEQDVKHQEQEVKKQLSPVFNKN